MKIKLIEIRDEGTTIPAAIIIPIGENSNQTKILERAGYFDNTSGVILMKIDGGNGFSTCDPYDWEGGRTMKIAHDWIRKNHKDLKDGDVIDVQYILGETSSKKPPEICSDIIPKYEYAMEKYRNRDGAV